MHKKQKNTVFVILCVACGCLLPRLLFAQLGGQTAYPFLRLPQSARVAGLGGVLISVKDDDAALAFANPAVLNPRMNGQLSFNSSFIAPEVFQGYAAYAHSFKKWTTHASVQYLNYGKMEATDEFGNAQGSFNTNDYTITLGAGRRLNKYYSFGVNARVMLSQLEQYRSTGLAADAALMYTDTAKGFTAALVARNLGGQITPYTAGKYERLPTEVQVGISQRLKHLPFRISLTVQHLDKWGDTLR